MTINAGWGELLVGAYLRITQDCELVTYNQRSREQGDQMELDVLGMRTNESGQTVFACEVVTHLHGLRYTGTPKNDQWSEYGSKQYQFTLEKTLKKFRADNKYVSEMFGDADEHIYQFWSPHVPEGNLTDGLTEVKSTFNSETDAKLELIINESYTHRIDELRESASNTRKDYGEPGFRILQILESLR